MYPQNGGSAFLRILFSHARRESDEKSIRKIRFVTFQGYCVSAERGICFPEGTFSWTGRERWVPMRELRNSSAKITVMRLVLKIQRKSYGCAINHLRIQYSNDGFTWFYLYDHMMIVKKSMRWIISIIGTTVIFALIFLTAYHKCIFCAGFDSPGRKVGPQNPFCNILGILCIRRYEIEVGGLRRIPRFIRKLQIFC